MIGIVRKDSGNNKKSSKKKKMPSSNRIQRSPTQANARVREPTTAGFHR
jgi:hypothetical protein